MEERKVNPVIVKARRMKAACDDLILAQKMLGNVHRLGVWAEPSGALDFVKNVQFEVAREIRATANEIEFIFTV